MGLENNFILFRQICDTYKMAFTAKRSRNTPVRISIEGNIGKFVSTNQNR